MSLKYTCRGEPKLLLVNFKVGNKSLHVPDGSSSEQPGDRDEADPEQRGDGGMARNGLIASVTLRGVTIRMWQVGCKCLG
jgi:hypothetical protein